MIVSTAIAFAKNHLTCLYFFPGDSIGIDLQLFIVEIALTKAIVLYKKFFENLGMKQIEFEDCKDVPHLHKGFYYRKFEVQ